MANVGGLYTAILSIIAWLYSSIGEHIFILDAIQNFYILKKPKEQVIFYKIKNYIIGKKTKIMRKITLNNLDQ